MSEPSPAEAPAAATESSTTAAAPESSSSTSPTAAEEAEAGPAPAVEADAAPPQHEDTDTEKEKAQAAAPVAEETAAAAAPEPPKEAEAPPSHGHGGHHHDLHAAAEAARAAKLQSAQRLQEFEAQRIAYFAPQIRSNATHWHAFTATLKKAETENERVLDFFSKRLVIEQQYSDKLRELPYEELKGGGGGWRSGGKGGHHQQKGHGTASSYSSSTRPTASKGSAAGKQQQPQQPQELAALRAHYRDQRVALPGMEELVGSMDALVAKYDEYVADTRKELLEGRLKPLASAYKATSDGILAEGSQALENVQRAEQHVQHAYTDLIKAIAALSPASVLQTGGTAPAVAAGEEHGAGGAGDLWLHDMQYRVVVELQKRVWATAQAQLGALFGRMKTLELNRRQQLHALILRFMQNQGGFWGQLPQLAADSALRISGLAPSDPEEVESALAEEIRLGARAAEEKEHEAAAKKKGGAGGPSSSSSQPPSSALPTTPAPATPSAEPFTGALRSPLDTPLVKRAEVLEHKHTTGMESLPLLKRWRPTLAVLTVDNVLHLFDLPPGAGAAADKALLGLAPKEAFRALVPQPLDSKGRVKKGKEAERIRPTASLALKRSKARFRPEEGDGAFDVTESTAIVGFTKVFKSHETRRVTLRARSQGAMVDWCVIVNGEEHSAS